MVVLIPVVLVGLALLFVFYTYGTQDFRFDFSAGDIIRFAISEMSTELMGAILISSVIYFGYKYLVEYFIERQKLNESLIPRSDHGRIERILQHYASSNEIRLDYIAYCDASDGTFLASELTTRFDKAVDIRSLRENRLVHEIADEEEERFRGEARKQADLIGKLNHEFENMGQGRMRKMLFDVVNGGFITIVVPSSDASTDVAYLFGATRDQEAVEDGVAMAQLKQIQSEVVGAGNFARTA